MTFEEAVQAIRPGRYRHFKGNVYEVVGLARHSETEEPMVVYRALYGEGGLWCRPAAMWNETVERNGKTYKRFYRLDRIERVETYERLFEEAMASHDPKKLRLLDDYYRSGAWRDDYEADELGELPPELKRGVLSQDALYDLLEGTRAAADRGKSRGEGAERKWKCPKCGREFSRQGQEHYCEKPETIDAYIAAQDESVQPRLREMREILRNAIPDAQERISWSMPTFWKGRNIIHFAASKKHLGLYPGGEATTVFAQELKGYDVSKGTIRLPWNKELPRELICRIAQWCFEAYSS